MVKQMPFLDSSASGTDFSYFKSTILPSLAGSWLKDSIAITYLAVPDVLPSSPENLGCGHMAFSAITGIDLSAMDTYFPSLGNRSWTNRRDMELAMKKVGRKYEKKSETWPVSGLCLLQWVGPWTKRGYPAAVLQHTHWVAVVENFVFDANWNGWLPKALWEEAIVSSILKKHFAKDWKPLTSYELLN